MVRKAQIVGIDWNRIARLHSLRVSQNLHNIMLLLYLCHYTHLGGWMHLDMPLCDGVMPLVNSYVMP